MAPARGVDGRSFAALRLQQRDERGPRACS